MTVSQLIESLKEFNPHDDVYLHATNAEGTFIEVKLDKITAILPGYTILEGDTIL